MISSRQILDKQASVGSAAALLVGKGVGHPRERKSACAYNDRARTLPQAWRPGRLHRRQSTAGHPRYARAGFAADPGSTPVCATRARHLRPTNPAAVASPDGAVWLCVTLCGSVWRCVALCGAVWRRVAPCGAVVCVGRLHDDAVRRQTVSGSAAAAWAPYLSAHDRPVPLLLAPIPSSPFPHYMSIDG